MKSKPQNLTEGASVLLLSTIAVKLIGALFKIPLSADFCLGDLGFGYFASAYDLYIPVNLIAMSGFPVAIARMVADYSAKNREEDINRLFKISYKYLSLAGLIITLAVVVLSLLFLSRNANGGLSVYGVCALAPSVLFCFIASVYRGFFEGKKNMAPTAVSSLIEALGKLVLGLSFALVSIKITHNPVIASAFAMFGITIGTALSLVYLHLKIKRCSPQYFSGGGKTVHDDNKVLKKLIAFSIPVVMSSLMISATSLIDTITVRSQLRSLFLSNPQAADRLLNDTAYGSYSLEILPTLIYGIRSKAATIFNLIPTFTTAFAISSVPVITENYAKNDVKQLKKNTNSALKLSSIITFPAAAGFIAVGPQIMRLLYGDKSFALGGKMLALYGVAAVFAGLSVPLTAILQATGRQNKAFLNIATGLVVKFICNIMLTKVVLLNIFGSIIATVICYALIFFLHFNDFYKIKIVNFGIGNSILKPMAASVLCGFSAYFTCKLFQFKWSVLLAILIAGIVYTAFLVVLRVFSKEDLTEIKEIFKK